MSIKTYIQGHSGVVTFVLILVVIFSVIGGRLATKQAPEASSSNTKRVVLVPATTFRDDLTAVRVDGVVESSSQVDIKSQVSAPVATVLVSVGDTVAQGQVLVEFQNTDIRAQLDQARAQLLIAEGQYSAGGVSTDLVRKSTIDTIRNAYAKADDIFHGQIGQFLYNTNPNTQDLQDYIIDSSLNNSLTLRWSSTERALDDFKQRVTTLDDNATQEQITSVLGVAQTSLESLSILVDTVSGAIINASRGAHESDLSLMNTWKATMSLARTSVSSMIASLTSSGTSLLTNQAQISSARAGVKNLEAQLSKTVIRAPISGIVAVLPLRVGELASPGQLITTIVGSGELEIKAYASSEDVDRIKKDARVIIEGKILGVVTSIAPSINALTKKVEVRMTVPAQERAHLVVGQSIQAKIQAPAPTTANTSQQPNYVLPIQNVKILPDAAYVYTVDADKKVVQHPVTLGDVKGDFVEVKTGLTDDMNIVSPVYELEEGEVVQTQ